MEIYRPTVPPLINESLPNDWQSISSPAEAGFFLGKNALEHQNEGRQMSMSEILVNLKVNSDFSIPLNVTQIDLDFLHHNFNQIRSNLKLDSQGYYSEDYSQTLFLSDSNSEEIIPGETRINNNRSNDDKLLQKQFNTFAELHVYRPRAFSSRLSSWFGIRHIMHEPPRPGHLHGLLTGKTPMVGVLNPRSWDLLIRNERTKKMSDQEAISKLQELYSYGIEEYADLPKQDLYSIYQEYFGAFAQHFGLRNFQAKPGGHVATQVDLLDFE